MTIRSVRAPVFMQEMLCEAIAYGNQYGSWWEWFTTDAVARHPWPGRETKRWAALDAKGRARWFTSQLWNCGDVVPADYLASLGVAPGMSYARVVSRLRRDLEPEPDAPGARIAPAQSRTPMSSSGRT